MTRTGTKAKKPGFLRRHPIAVLAGIVAVIALAIAGYFYWRTLRPPLRDDGRRLHRLPRSSRWPPKVSGYVVDVPVTDNQHVDAGDVLFEIDQRDYQIAIDQAKAQVVAAQAAIEGADAQIAAQRAQIDEAQGAGRPGRGQPQLRAGGRRPLSGPPDARRQLRPAGPAIDRQPSAAAGQPDARQCGGERGAAAGRLPGSPEGERRRQPDPGADPARAGRTEPVLHDRHGGPARPRRAA